MKRSHFYHWLKSTNHELCLTVLALHEVLSSGIAIGKEEDPTVGAEGESEKRSDLESVHSEVNVRMHSESDEYGEG